MKIILLLAVAQIAHTSISPLFTLTGQEEQYCASYDGISCHTCYASFLTPNNRCAVPTRRIDRCLTYLTNDRCNSCQFNYQLINNECHRNTLDRCVKQSNGRCEICGEGLLVNPVGLCQIDRHCSDINCSYCYVDNGSDYCAICRPGFVLSGPTQDVYLKQTCVRQTAKTQNCLMLDATQLQCQTCQLNYYMDSQRNCIRSNAYHMDLLGYSQNLLASLLMFMIMFF